MNNINHKHQHHKPQIHHTKKKYLNQTKQKKKYDYRNALTTATRYDRKTYSNHSQTLHFKMAILRYTHLHTHIYTHKTKTLSKEENKQSKNGSFEHN